MHSILLWTCLMVMSTGLVNTVNGPVPVQSMGRTLVHEHFLVDFIGANQVNSGRWDRAAVVKKVLPYVLEVKKLGIKTIFDCTPAYLGRDPLLLKELADRAGINIVTNTGLYGAGQNKYLPEYAYTESGQELASRWIREFEEGIDGTGIRAGFIKIGVKDTLLSPLHRKLVQAAAITHLATGLTICSHTGLAIAAFDEMRILQESGVSLTAFVWVHAQAEPEISKLLEAARMGAWISLDGMGWGEVGDYLAKLAALKNAGLLRHVLISHDAGWYKPGEPGGGEFKGFTNISNQVFPALLKNGFTQYELDTLLIINPATAFNPIIRKVH